MKTNKIIDIRKMILLDDIECMKQIEFMRDNLAIIAKGLAEIEDQAILDELGK